MTMEEKFALARWVRQRPFRSIPNDFGFLLWMYLQIAQREDMIRGR